MMMHDLGYERHWTFEKNARMFMVIKDVAVLKKLSGDPAWAFANGDELMNNLEPGWTGYSYFRLESYRKALERLKEAELIVFRKRVEGPYGYGDDEQFWLSPRGIRLVEDHKGNEALKEAVIQKLAEAAGY